MYLDRDGLSLVFINCNNFTVYQEVNNLLMSLMCFSLISTKKASDFVMQYFQGIYDHKIILINFYYVEFSILPSFCYLKLQQQLQSLKEF